MECLQVSPPQKREIMGSLEWNLFVETAASNY